MQVKNRLTGNISHVRNNDRDTLFGIRTGLYEVVDSTPNPNTGDVVVQPGVGVFPAMEPANTSPRWTVIPNLGGAYQITLTIGHTVSRFDGPVKDAAKAFHIPTPPHIVAEYARQKTR